MYDATNAETGAELKLVNATKRSCLGASLELYKSILRTPLPKEPHHVVTRSRFLHSSHRTCSCQSKYEGKCCTCESLCLALLPSNLEAATKNVLNPAGCGVPELGCSGAGDRAPFSFPSRTTFQSHITTVIVQHFQPPSFSLDEQLVLLPCNS